MPSRITRIGLRNGLPVFHVKEHYLAGNRAYLDLKLTAIRVHRIELIGGIVVALDLVLNFLQFSRLRSQHAHLGFSSGNVFVLTEKKIGGLPTSC